MRCVKTCPRRQGQCQRELLCQLDYREDNGQQWYVLQSLEPFGGGDGIPSGGFFDYKIRNVEVERRPMLVPPLAASISCVSRMTSRLGQAVR